MDDESSPNGEDARQKYFEQIKRSLNQIQTRQDLADFIFDLAEGFEDGYFEEQSVADYLEGAGALTNAMDNWYRNRKLDEDPESPNWRMFGRVLFAAFYHS